MAKNIPAKAGSKYGDLYRRLIFLVLALVVYRIGTHIPVPGIDPDTLKELFNQQQGGILGLFNMFSGGALSSKSGSDAASSLTWSVPTAPAAAEASSSPASFAP